MDNLIEKLKSLKNASSKEYHEAIQKHSHKQIIKELKEAGLSKDDISEEEFDELLQDKITQNTSFAKGAMVAGGALLFLQLLG